MRERSVARFLVAPDGFGKSEIALEYADLIFSFRNTFWFDAGSPCFLRDLDRGTFADVIYGKDPSVRLVVFDSVPRLDSDRADELSRTIDDLLARGSEVVVTMPPSCDAYGGRQADRIRLGASDMLLSDAEIDAARSGEERARIPASDLPASDRVPVIAWGGEGGSTKLLQGIVSEDLPSDVLAAIFEMLVLVEGRMDEIETAGIGGASSSVDAVPCSADYPYLGIDAAAERFEGPEMPVDAVVKAFAPHLPSMAAERGRENVDEFVGQLANRLIVHGRPDRACDLVRSALTRPAREAWLAMSDRDLLERGCFDRASALYASARPGSTASGGRMRAAEAVRAFLLGEEPEARDLAMRVTLSPSASDEARGISATLALAIDPTADREAAIAALSRAVGVAPVGVTAQIETAIASRRDLQRCVWWPVGVVALAAEERWSDGVSVWRRLRTAGVPLFALAVAGASLLRRACDDAADPDVASVEEVAAYLVEYVERDVEVHGFAGLASQLCLRAIEPVRMRGLAGACPDLAPTAARAARRADAQTLSQRVAYQATRRPARGDEGGRRYGGDSDRHAVHVARKSPPAPPPIKVNLFGGLAVSIDGVPIDSVLLRRKKVKTLLAILALDAGREVPRDTLVGALWPASPIDTARKNLYTLWSLLRRALALPDGTCPYLVRMQNGYKFDDRAFESDVRRVDELIRTLLFGRTDARVWMDVLSELSELCAADLLPCEAESDLITQRRTEYRMLVVDALVAASQRLSAEGDAQTALWFARAAFDRERGREDVYAALMRAQIATGQRTSALETFFECRRFLADGLGIDPSTDVVSLYRSIIEEEAIVDW